MTTITPPIKWVGGKTKLLPELVRRMPDTYGRYYEPFAGGAALFFRTNPVDAVLADRNADLITLYDQLAENPEPVIRRLRYHKRRHGRRYYYSMRERWNDPTATLERPARAALFIYLNKTCFNGLWRVNKRGQFNVPMGRYKDPQIYVPSHLRTVGGALAGTEIRCCDYADAVADATKDDFVYFDPPYDPITTTSNFTGYQSGGFSRVDQKKLSDVARQLVARGVKVMLSNNDTKLVRKLYKGFKIHKVECGRAINSDTTKRGKVTEVIITAGY